MIGRLWATGYDSIHSDQSSTRPCLESVYIASRNDQEIRRQVEFNKMK